MIVQTMRRAGAVTLLAVGAVHLQRYLGGGYNAIPTIGPLFLLNAIASAVVAIGLLAPLERVPQDRLANLTLGVLAITAVLIASGSLVALLISENGTLFGFSESGYGTAMVISIVVEGATILLLAPVAAVSLAQAAARDTAPRSPRAFSSQ